LYADRFRRRSQHTAHPTLPGRHNEGGKIAEGLLGKISPLGREKMPRNNQASLFLPPPKAYSVKTTLAAFLGWLHPQKLSVSW